MWRARNCTIRELSLLLSFCVKYRPGDVLSEPQLSQTGITESRTILYKEVWKFLPSLTIPTHNTKLIIWRSSFYVFSPQFKFIDWVEEDWIDICFLCGWCALQIAAVFSNDKFCGINGYIVEARSWIHFLKTTLMFCCKILFYATNSLFI